MCPPIQSRPGRPRRPSLPAVASCEARIYGHSLGLRLDRIDDGQSPMCAEATSGSRLKSRSARASAFSTAAHNASTINQTEFVSGTVKSRTPGWKLGWQAARSWQSSNEFHLSCTDVYINSSGAQLRCWLSLQHFGTPLRQPAVVACLSPVGQ